MADHPAKSAVENQHERFKPDRRLMNELLDICADLGDRDEDGTFVPGEQTYEALQDLLRALRRQDPYVRPVFLITGGWNIFKKYLVPLVISCHDDFNLIYAVVKVMCLLCQDPQENHSYPLLQKKYMADIKVACCESGFVTALMTTVGAPLSRILSGSGEEHDKLYLEMLLDVLAHVCGFEVHKEAHDSARAHDLLAEQFAEGAAFDVLLLLAQELSSLNDVNPKFGRDVFRIIAFTVRRFRPEEVGKLVGTKSKAEAAMKEFKEMREKEALVRKAQQAKLPARHSRFGGLYVQKMPEVGVQKMYHKLEHVGTKNEKKKTRTKASQIERQDEAASEYSSVNSRMCLNHFMDGLTSNAGFSNIFGDVMRRIVSRPERLVSLDGALFLDACTFVLAWHRERSTCEQKVAEHDHQTFIWDSSSLNIVFDKDFLLLVMKTINDQLISSESEKNYDLLIRCLKFVHELIVHTEKMHKSGNEPNKMMAEYVQANFLTQREFIYMFPKIFGNYLPKRYTYEFLCETLESCYYITKYAERYAKDGQIEVLVAVSRSIETKLRGKEVLSSGSKLVEGGEEVDDEEEEEGRDQTAQKDFIDDSELTKGGEEEELNEEESENKDPDGDENDEMEHAQPEREETVRKSPVQSISAGAQHKNGGNDSSSIPRNPFIAKAQAMLEAGESDDDFSGDAQEKTRSHGAQQDIAAGDHAPDVERPSEDNEDETANQQEEQPADPHDGEKQEADDGMDEADMVKRTMLSIDQILNRFTTSHVLESLMRILARYPSNSAKINHYALHFCNRIFSDLDLPVMFYTMPFFLLAEKILHRDASMFMSASRLRDAVVDWRPVDDFVQKVLLRFFEADIDSNSLLFLEVLFNRSAHDSKVIQSNYKLMERRGGKDEDGAAAGEQQIITENALEDDDDPDVLTGELRLNDTARVERPQLTAAQEQEDWDTIMRESRATAERQGNERVEDGDLFDDRLHEADFVDDGIAGDFSLQNADMETGSVFARGRTHDDVSAKRSRMASNFDADADADADAEQPAAKLPKRAALLDSDTE